jgi:hypothetical protein
MLATYSNIHSPSASLNSVSLIFIFVTCAFTLFALTCETLVASKVYTLKHASTVSLVDWFPHFVHTLVSVRDYEEIT